jgi:hypothetical protein
LFFRIIILFIGLTLICQPFFGQRAGEILVLEQGLNKSMPDNARIKYLYNLADLYDGVDTVKFSKYVSEGFLMSKKNNDLGGIGSYYEFMALKDLMRLKYDLAQYESAKAAYFYLKAKDTTSYLNVNYVHLRSIFEAGQTKNFVQIADKSLKLSDKGFWVERGKIYSILATFYRKSNPSISKANYQNAVKCFYLSKDVKWLVNPFLNLSRIYNLAGQKDSAIYFSRQAVKYAEHSKSNF